MKHLLLLTLIIVLPDNFATVDLSQCIAPLGMENGAIKDRDITASSSFDSSNVGPQHGRVRTDRNGGAWCPMKQATTESEEWLQVDLNNVHMVTATGTQGRFGNGVGIEYTEYYILEYWRPKLSKWVRYHTVKGDEVLHGNINTYLESKRDLSPTLWASKIRFYPYSQHQRTVCMRVELYGCRWLDGIVSYSMPQGDKRGSNWQLLDFSYDGQWVNGELTNGLGQLVDGRFGPDDFKADFYSDYPSWVGWKNDSGHPKPLELRFEFDRVREFTNVHIYSSNQFTKDIAIFSQVKISFSIGGKRFRGEPITFEYVEDRIFENGRNVTVKLHHRVGRFVRIQLHFAAKWILISEITFESMLAYGNFSLEADNDSTNNAGQHRQHYNGVQSIAANSNTHVRSSVRTLSRNNSSSDSIDLSQLKYVESPALLTSIVIILSVIIVFLGGAIYVIVRRIHTRNKALHNPHTPSLGDTISSHQTERKYAYCDKDFSSVEAYGVTEIDEFHHSHTTLRSSMKSTLPLQSCVTNAVELSHHVYQEPYTASNMNSYHSYSSVLDMDVEDDQQQHFNRRNQSILQHISNIQSNQKHKKHHVPTTSDYSITHADGYAVPGGVHKASLQLLPKFEAGPLTPASRASINSNGSVPSNGKSSKKMATLITANDETRDFKCHTITQQSKDNLHQRLHLDNTDLPSYPRHRLRMLSKLSEGGFGSLYIAESDNATGSCQLVAVKILKLHASDKERRDFSRDFRILSGLNDPNVCRVLGICEEEPLSVVLEYTKHGDLCQFLKLHTLCSSHSCSSNSSGSSCCNSCNMVSLQEDDDTLSNRSCTGRSISSNCLLYMGAQIASGMRFLESLNFVHRDIATRNCLVGDAYTVKICDFGTHNESYRSDYYKVDGNVPIPIRWMAWESVYQARYTTKSDVWSFGVTLWEIFTLCRQLPYDQYSDPEVLENLAHVHCDDGQFVYLRIPKTPLSVDVYDLMLECWRRRDTERPTFTQIHLFLQRKNLGYAPY